MYATHRRKVPLNIYFAVKFLRDESRKCFFIKEAPYLWRSVGSIVYRLLYKISSAVDGA